MNRPPHLIHYAMGMDNHLILVREATPADEEAVAEVSRLATEDLRRVYRPVAPAVASAPQPPTGRLVAEVGGRIVGTVRYRCEQPRIHLIGLFVHPEQRRKGVARELVRSLDALAVITGTDCLSLFTVRQTGNVSIFERLGFRAIREVTPSWAESTTGQPLTEVYMEKPIAGG